MVRVSVRVRVRFLGLRLRLGLVLGTCESRLAPSFVVYNFYSYD